MIVSHLRTHAEQVNAAPQHDLASPFELITPERLASTKISFMTRRARRTDFQSLITQGQIPHAGDLVLARVQQLGQHRYLQLPDGRRSALYVGDEIVVAYGARYAPDQFEARVPEHFGRCHLVAGGGMAAEALSWSSSVKAPTKIEPLGFLGDKNGKVLNLKDFALPVSTGRCAASVPVIAMVGTAMNAGKTTAAASLIHGAMLAQLRVGAAKVTGTGAGNDYWTYVDAGARSVLDFTDCGYASTYLAGTEAVEKVLAQLVMYLQAQNVDIIVLEIADGLCQEETAALLSSPLFTNLVDGVVFCAGDAMGAIGGVDWLEQRSVPVFGVSGCLTKSPLACREARRGTRLPVWTRSELMDATTVRTIVAHSRRRMMRTEALG